MSEVVRRLVADAKTRIASARDPDHVRRALDSVARLAFAEEDRNPGDGPLHAEHEGDANRGGSAAEASSSAVFFFAEQYANWAHFLVHFVLPNWALALTRDERTRLVDAFFVSPRVPALDAFLALGAQALNELNARARAREEASASQSTAGWNEGLRFVVSSTARSTATEGGAQRSRSNVDSSSLSSDEQGMKPIGVSKESEEEEQQFIVEAVADLLAGFIGGGGVTRLFDHFVSHAQR